MSDHYIKPAGFNGGLKLINVTPLPSYHQHVQRKLYINPAKSWKLSGNNTIKIPMFQIIIKN